MYRCIAVAVAILALPVSLVASAPSISGVVTEHGRLLLQSVTVTATDAGGTSCVTQTGEDGAFAFEALPTGVYSLAAELPGFGPVLVTGVRVTPEQPAMVPLSMTTVPIRVSLTVTRRSQRARGAAALDGPQPLTARASR